MHIAYSFRAGGVERKEKGWRHLVLAAAADGKPNDTELALYPWFKQPMNATRAVNLLDGFSMAAAQLNASRQLSIAFMKVSVRSLMSFARAHVHKCGLQPVGVLNWKCQLDWTASDKTLEY